MPVSSSRSKSGKSITQWKRSLVRREPELTTEVDAEAAEHARDRRLVAGCEEHRRARLAAERLELAPRRGTSRSASAPRRRRRRGTRDPWLPTPSRPPRAAAAPSARTRAARRGSARSRQFAKTPNSEPRVTSVASWISSPKRRSGLSVPYRASASAYVRRGNGRVGASRPRACERVDDDLLEHVEHVLALDERQLEVELPELELPVGAQILVPPAGRDLVVAVEPADHAELLEDLRRLREREEAARLKTHGHDEVARALRRPARHARRPDVDEAETVHRPSDRRDDGVRQCAGFAASGRCAGRASGSGGGASRRRPPRRAGTGAASSARRSRARRPGARPRRSASPRSPSRASARRPHRAHGARTRCGSPWRARRPRPSAPG